MLPLSYVVFMPYGFLFFMMTIFGTIYSLSAVHWLAVWGGLEINLIAFIPLMVYRGTTLETESAIKYFIFQAVGSTLLMFSSLLSFSTTFVWDMSLTMLPSMTEKSSLILLLGLTLKLGAFPVHSWFPSVAAGLSWMANLWLFTWQKVAPLFLLFSLTYLWTNMLFFLMMMIASGSSIIGGIGGMNQTQLRALLAYSSIAHLGWMTFCCYLSETSMKIYFVIYIFITVCIFTILWVSEMNLIPQALNSFYQSKTIFRGAIILLLLSLGGIPPLLGFVPKWMVLNLGASTNLTIILLLLIFGSLCSLFYYLNLMFSSFFSIAPIILKEMYTQKFNNFSISFVVILSITVNLLGGIFLLKNSFLESFLYAMGLFNKP
uniref:NADH-ubiquinone oxidoreductase chain 2 n=1 Tax=Chrysomallon squamiferum TaxID=216257 RepID=S6BMK7_CHRSQ|nr:NADH dehydrogenase subunit 2 [Chrysomallon squamiferum]